MSSSGDQENAKIQTIPSDARFHNQNVTDWCMVSFVDYHKCVRLLGEGSGCCGKFEQIYKTICPNDWIKRWEDQIKEGNFPVDLPPRENDCAKLPSRRMNI